MYELSQAGGNGMVDKDQEVDFHISFDDGSGNSPIEFKMEFATIYRPCVDCNAEVELFGVKDEIKEDQPRCVYCDWIYGRLYGKDW